MLRVAEQCKNTFWRTILNTVFLKQQLVTRDIVSSFSFRFLRNNGTLKNSHKNIFLIPFRLDVLIAWSICATVVFLFSSTPFLLLLVVYNQCKNTILPAMRLNFHLSSCHALQCSNAEHVLDGLVVVQRIPIYWLLQQ